MPAVFPSAPDAAYTYVQMTPASGWSITHHLGKKPAVAVIDSAGSLVTGDVVYDTDNHLIITFTGGFAGEAHLN